MYREYVVEYRNIDTWELSSRHFATEAEAEAFENELRAIGGFIINVWGF